MYKKGRSCFLCGKNGCAEPLDTHHIFFGGGLRSKSDRYGLTVSLCTRSCHEYGPDSAHQNAQVREMLHKYGQRKAMLEQGWSVEEFILEFGKNYLDYEEIDELEAERNAPAESFVSSFFITDEELPY